MEPVRKSPIAASDLYVHSRAFLAGQVLSRKSRPSSLYFCSGIVERNEQKRERARKSPAQLVLKSDARVKPPSIEPALVH